MNNREVDNKAEKKHTKIKNYCNIPHAVLEDPRRDSIAALEDRSYSLEVVY